MIADDMITFIKKDLRVFGIAVFFLMAATIAFIFRRYYWVLSTMLICAVSIIWTVGILGWAGWEVTVISSNFISLQLIITLAMTIHLMVRYREFNREQPQASQYSLMYRHYRWDAAALHVFRVHDHSRFCFFDILQYQAGNRLWLHHDGRCGYFHDRAFSAVAFDIIVFCPRTGPAPQTKSRWQLTPMLGRFTLAHGRLIIVISGVLLVVNALGISRLKVENCFINYFRSNTEINQGLKVWTRALAEQHRWM